LGKKRGTQNLLQGGTKETRRPSPKLPTGVSKPQKKSPKKLKKKLKEGPNPPNIRSQYRRETN